MVASSHPCLDPDTACAYLTGWYEGAERGQIEAHLRACSVCHDQVEVARVALRGSLDRESRATASAATAVLGRIVEILPPGTHVGPYIVDQPIGLGGMGVVYAAHDPRLHRTVALKAVRRDVVSATDRVVREARAMARLAHPNVVAIHDLVVEDGQLFLAMQHVPGSSLQRWLATTARPWRAIVDAFLAAGAGLAAAHAQGIVHRDFKPANVLRSDDGRIWVTDFGLALVAGEPLATAHDDTAARLTETGGVLGTRAYMAPEQRRGETADARSDQYSFCVALGEALRGTQAPARLLRLLARGMREDPDQRFPAMSVLVAELARIRSRRRIVGVGLGGLAALGVAILALRPGGREAAVHECEHSTREITEVWGPTQRARIERAFAAVDKPFAADAWRGTERTLDRFVGEWTAVRRAACEATWVTREQSSELLELRVGCLSDRARELGALVEQLAVADAAVVGRSVGASQSLTAVARCSDRRALLATQPAPDDAAVRAQVQIVRDALARVRAMRLAGRYRTALPLARVAVAAADASRYVPVQAEARYQHGLLQGVTNEFADAEASLLSAARLADASRDDRMRAAIWSSLILFDGHYQGRFDRVPMFRELALGALDRLGSTSEEESLLLYNLATVYNAQGKTSEARSAIERSLELRLAQFGPDHQQVAYTLTQLGNILLVQGDRDGALARYARAREIAERTIGRFHPNTAIVDTAIAIAMLEGERPADASPILERAIPVLESAYGPKHVQLAETIDELGRVSFELGAYERARNLHERSLAMRTELLAVGSPEVSRSRCGLGKALWRLGLRERARTELELAAATPATGDGLDRAEAQFALARVLGELGRDPARARALATDARAVYSARARSAVHRRELVAIERWLGEVRAR